MSTTNQTADRRLAVIVLNYRTPDLVKQCLASLDGQIDPALDTVIVVDNDSDDGSADEIRAEIQTRRWHAWALLIEAERNGGFSYGNNVGISAVSAEFYLLLNSDTIVRADAIASMRERLAERADVGLLGPRLEWPDGEGQVSAFRDITPLGQLVSAAKTGPISKLLPRHVVATELSERPVEAHWVSFACVLIRRAVVDQIGPMDEGYFMYFEDADYCRKARAAGWRVLHDPAARVVHLRGGTSPVKELARRRKRLPRYFYRSRARYFRRHYGLPGLVAANLLWTGGLMVELVRRVFGRPRSSPAGSFRDVWTDTLHPRRAEGESANAAEA